MDLENLKSKTLEELLQIIGDNHLREMQDLDKWKNWKPRCAVEQTEPTPMQIALGECWKYDITEEEFIGATDSDEEVTS